MSFLHSYLVNPEKLIICWIFMLQILPENQGICITKDTFHCQNRVRSFIECRLQEGVTINSVTLVRPNPFLHCRYNIGRYSRRRYVPKGYGYFGNVLWVTKSCRLRYKVCYSKSTASKGTSVMKQPTTASNATSLPSTVVSNTDEDSLKNISDWYLNESHVEEAQKLKSNKTLIVATVVSLTMASVGLAALGLYFWRKRPNRHRKSKESSNKIENTYGLLEPGVKDNSYFILEPQKEYSPIQHNRLELQWKGSKEGNLQHEVTEASSDKVVFDPNDTYCTINEVADAIQSLPDNEYNILNTKSKYFCPDSNYHSFQTMQIEKGYFSADDSAYTSTANTKVINTVVDYSHIYLDRSLVPDERTFDNQYSHLSSL